MGSAEAICGEGLLAGSVLDLVGRLVDKSLVIVDPLAQAGETRYRLLETIRQYALEKMIAADEAPHARKQHLEFYVRLAEAWEARVYRSEPGVVATELLWDLDDIRAAVEWSTSSGSADQALRILGSLVFFWFGRGIPSSAWNESVQAAFRCPESQGRTLARAKALTGFEFWYWADELVTDRRANLEEALSIGRELGDPWTTATALRGLGVLLGTQADFGDAKSSLEESLELWRGTGKQFTLGTAMTLTFLGDIAWYQDQKQVARAFYEESTSLLNEASDININFQAYTVRRLGNIAWRAGDYPRALAHCADSLRLNLLVDDPRGICACLGAYAAIAVARQQFEVGATLAAAMEAQLALFGCQLPHVDSVEYDRNLAQIRARLAPKKLANLWTRGQRMSLQAAIGYATGGGG
jgi:tetratricopeptide (TPR) repeat protein